MPNNSYQCDSCNSTFTRKSNAKRHILTIHQGGASAFNIVTGESLASTIEEPKHIGIESLPAGMDFELFQGNASRTDEEEEVERILVEILEKIRKPLEELEELTVNQSESQRSKYLSNQISMALLSSDPLRTLEDVVSFIKTFKMRGRIGTYISRSINLTPSEAQILLSQNLKLGRYYRNKMESKRKSVQSIR
jgi:hypothetical protein